MFNKCSRDLLSLKIMSEKCWIECEVNKSRELSVESNMPPKTKMRTEETHLVWTDHEVQLLLETTRDFEAMKTYARVDWESIKGKYEKIRETFVSKLPKQTGSEESVYSTDFFTKEKTASKIKRIRVKYWKALDAGRQSGGGSIVATSYLLSSEIWSGSRATKSIQAGLETAKS